MRAAEDAFNPLLLRDIEVDSCCGVRIVAENRDNRVALVKNHQPPVQIRHGHVVTLNGGGCGHSKAGHDFLNEVSVEVVMQQATLRFVVAVANQQAGRVISRIQSHAMRSIELLEVVPFGPEVHQVFPRPVKLKNDVARVAVG